MPRIQNKRGTSANLASVNPTPLAGELVWDSSENAIKIGDGATAWTSLAYVTATPRSHNHDDRYYTESEVDGLLAAKSDTSHNHGLSSLSDVSAAAPISDKAFLVYSSSLSQWVASTGIGQVGVGSQPLGGWPAGSVGASLAGKVDTSDSRLSDARTPTAHKSSHATGGSDALTPSDIGAAPAASPVFSGNVGIGVNPAGSFNSAFDDLVVGTGTGNRGITINTDSSSNATLSFADGTSGAAAYAGAIQYSHSTDTLAFWTASASRVTIGSTGVITVAAGTAAAPAIVASGDSNTGAFFPAADTFAISTAGVERLRVDSSGNVGIGTSPSPFNALFNNLVVGNGSSTEGMTIYSSTQGTLAFGDTATTAVDGYRGSLSYIHSGDYMAIGTGGAERFRASAGGIKVTGVITADATSGSAGSYAPSLTFSGDPNTGFGQVSGQSDTASVFTAGLERVRVKSGGAVRFVPLSADPASGEAGDVYYNSSTSKLRVYNGTSWVDLH